AAPAPSVCRRTVSSLTQTSQKYASSSAARAKGMLLPNRTSPSSSWGLRLPGTRPSASSRGEKPGVAGRADEGGALKAQGRGLVRDQHLPHLATPSRQRRPTARTGRPRRRDVLRRQLGGESLQQVALEALRHPRGELLQRGQGGGGMRPPPGDH